MWRNHFERKHNWERMINPVSKRQLPGLPGGTTSAASSKGVGYYFDHPGQKLERSLNTIHAVNLAMCPGLGQCEE